MAELPISFGASPRIEGRWARANPHRGFLKRRLRAFGAGIAVAAVISCGLGVALISLREELSKGDINARSVQIPPELLEALSSPTDDERLRAAIHAHPSEALTLLVDTHSRPDHPLKGMADDSVDQLLTRHASAFPLRELRNVLEAIFDQPENGPLRMQNLREKSRALLLLEYHSDTASLEMLQRFRSRVRDKRLRNRIEEVLRIKR